MRWRAGLPARTWRTRWFRFTRTWPGPLKPYAARSSAVQLLKALAGAVARRSNGCSNAERRLGEEHVGQGLERCCATKHTMCG
jgi:hypothetical protein